MPGRRPAPPRGGGGVGLPETSRVGIKRDRPACGRRQSASSPALLLRWKIPRPMRARDAELRLPAPDPAGMIVDLPFAQTHHIPAGCGLIPIAEVTHGERVAGIQIGLGV